MGGGGGGGELRVQSVRHRRGCEERVRIDAQQLPLDSESRDSASVATLHLQLSSWRMSIAAIIAMTRDMV